MPCQCIANKYSTNLISLNVSIGLEINLTMWLPPFRHAAPGVIRVQPLSLKPSPAWFSGQVFFVAGACSQSPAFLNKGLSTSLIGLISTVVYNLLEWFITTCVLLPSPLAPLKPPFPVFHGSFSGFVISAHTHSHINTCVLEFICVCGQVAVSSLQPAQCPG